ncbi:trafficking protein particle complex subunit 4 [Cyclospora cayetanensis]|uniref:Trafficking protein particle complex subunit n=1 Tax=Cyclospora cayetanensis TaxID=88456 RepID=A0A6P6S089_9EIME|nr:trafficking protein particle complex subunit 4 [Cyclospora cayetanensis]
MLSLFINNKHGSLVFQRNFREGLCLKANDAIRQASTFHGLSEIAAQLSPVRPPAIGELSFIQPKGICIIEAFGFKVQCLETLTGLRFVLVAETGVSSQLIENCLRQAYAAYTDFGLKNPFYDLDMPLRCQLFEEEIDKIFGDYTKS